VVSEVSVLRPEVGPLFLLFIDFLEGVASIRTIRLSCKILDADRLASAGAGKLIARWRLQLRHDFLRDSDR